MAETRRDDMALALLTTTDATPTYMTPHYDFMADDSLITAAVVVQAFTLTAGVGPIIDGASFSLAGTFILRGARGSQSDPVGAMFKPAPDAVDPGLAGIDAHLVYAQDGFRVEVTGIAATTIYWAGYMTVIHSTAGA